MCAEGALRLWFPMVGSTTESVKMTNTNGAVKRPNDDLLLKGDAKELERNQPGARVALPFWEKPLDELSRGEWERLCDGCGRCCLIKLEDEDTGAIHHTSVACKLLDKSSCRCGDYSGRKKIVPDCVRLTLDKLAKINWLPPSCAYKLRYENKELPLWHPLLSGDSESVHQSGISVRGRVEAGEEEVDTDDLPEFIRLWPKRWPKKARPTLKARTKS